MTLERLPWRKRRNLILVGLDELLGRATLMSLPPVVLIEPVARCNLRCPFCATGTGEMQRERGAMSMETFHRLLDELEDVLICVMLYGWGEPFMSDRTPAMIEACTRRDILTMSSTNGHYLQTLDEALRVVDAGLTCLVVALDGSTQDVYGTYRKRGDVEKVKRCAEMIQEAKAICRSRLPYLNIRAVVTRHNEADLPNIEAFAKQIGADMFSYKSLGCLAASKESAEYQAHEPEMRRVPHGRSASRDGRRWRCIFPFRPPLVLWDGTVISCEYDYDLEMPLGKVGERPFQEIWNSPNAIRVRRSILNGAGPPGFCSRCPNVPGDDGRALLATRELRPVATPFV